MKTKIRVLSQRSFFSKFHSINPKFQSFSLGLQSYLVLILPPLLFCSYHPIISFGSSATMNFELSLPLIWLALFFVVSLPKTFDNLRFFGSKALPLVAFPLFAATSVLWSDNQVRGLLTAGVLLLLCFAIFSVIPLLSQNSKLKNPLLKSFIFSAVIFGIFCWMQCLLDIFGMSREFSLLCPGCTYQSFGFPHPNGFAIEPQFMGNLLLAPALLALFLIMKPAKPPIKHLRPITFFLLATLFLTFSRGAIFAFFLGAFVLFFGLLIINKNLSHLLRSFALIPLAFVVALSAQGIFAEISPAHDTFISATAKSIHHLSLGKIDLRPKSKFTQQTSSSTTIQAETKSPNSPSFSGYVAESTDIRLKLTDLALDAWDNQRTRMLFGSGLGSAGTIINQTFPHQTSAKEIIQNQYASLLLETGILGAIFLGFSLFLLTKIVFPLRRAQQVLILAVFISFAFTLGFFSGLPNALHICLFMPILYFLTAQSSNLKKFVS